MIPLGANGELPAPADATTIPLGGEIAYTDGFNANGITWARGWLIIVQSNLGLVFKVDPATGDGTQIDLTGPNGEFLVVNGDGIEVRGNSLAVVRNFNNQVVTFKLNGQLTAGTLTDEIESDGSAIPTTATWAAGDLWAVNSRFDVPNPPPDALLDHARSGPLVLSLALALVVVAALGLASVRLAPGPHRRFGGGRRARWRCGGLLARRCDRVTTRDAWLIDRAEGDERRKAQRDHERGCRRRPMGARCFAPEVQRPG